MKSGSLIAVYLASNPSPLNTSTECPDLGRGRCDVAKIDLRPGPTAFLAISLRVTRAQGLLRSRDDGLRRRVVRPFVPVPSVLKMFQ